MTVIKVSFPGGHIEPGEGPIEAALRETREEVGPSLGHVEVLGTCQAVPAGIKFSSQIAVVKTPQRGVTFLRFFLLYPCSMNYRRVHGRGGCVRPFDILFRLWFSSPFRLSSSNGHDGDPSAGVRV